MDNADCKLISITDVRPIDWFTGKRIPLSACEIDAPTCDRCGRKHAIIWKIDTPRGIVKVGSGCGPKLLEGWNPEPFDLKEARARVREEAAENVAAQVDEIAQPIADAVSAMTMPEPVISDEQPYDLVVVWNIGGAQQSIPHSNRDRDWDRVLMRGAWETYEIGQIVNNLYPLANDDTYSDENREVRKRRNRISSRAKTLLNRSQR